MGQSPPHVELYVMFPYALLNTSNAVLNAQHTNQSKKYYKELELCRALLQKRRSNLAKRRSVAIWISEDSTNICMSHVTHI